MEQGHQDIPDAILRHIDSILFEPQALRQAISAWRQDRDENLVAKLYGSWGQGSWEEYESDVEWQRFSDE